MAKLLLTNVNACALGGCAQCVCIWTGVYVKIVSHPWVQVSLSMLIIVFAVISLCYLIFAQNMHITVPVHLWVWLLIGFTGPVIPGLIFIRSILHQVVFDGRSRSSKRNR